MRRFFMAVPEPPAAEWMGRGRVGKAQECVADARNTGHESWRLDTQRVATDPAGFLSRREGGCYDVIRMHAPARLAQHLGCS